MLLAAGLGANLVGRFLALDGERALHGAELACSILDQKLQCAFPLQIESADMVCSHQHHQRQHEAVNRCKTATHPMTNQTNLWGAVWCRLCSTVTVEGQHKPRHTNICDTLSCARMMQVYSLPNTGTVFFSVASSQQQSACNRS
jgi:hypothetical protein